MGTTLICHGCRTVAVVNKVTPNITCTCAHPDLDLYEPRSVTHRVQAASDRGFLEWMGVTANSGGTGWGQPHPDELKGWSEYPGPMPGPNPGWGVPDAMPKRCENCHGSGWSLRERCRACKGTGMHHPPTSETPAPQVAKHPGQTTVPFVGRRRQGGRKSTDPLGSPEEHIRKTTPGYTNQGYRAPGENFDGRPDSFYPSMPNMSPNVKTRQDRDYSVKPSEPLKLNSPCPECGHPHTDLVTDNTPAEDGWWHCPNCGPLVNIDKHPEVNPYDHGTYPGRDSGFKSAKKSRPGRVMRMVASVSSTNPGLSTREVLDVVRRTVQKYSE